MVSNEAVKSRVMGSEEPSSQSNAAEQGDGRQELHGRKESQLQNGVTAEGQAEPYRASSDGLLPVGTGAEVEERISHPGQPAIDTTSSDSASWTSSDEEESPTANEGSTAPRSSKSDWKRKNKGAKDEGRKNNGHSHFSFHNDFFKSKVRPSGRDGRLKVSVNRTANSGYVGKALGQSIQNHLNIPHKHKSRNKSGAPDEDDGDDDAESIASSLPNNYAKPRLNIVIMVIGSRGDIQPFLKVGQILKQKYGHRVRVASHPTFRDFVEKQAGLEFFSVGGDPSELMAFMVKNPGLMPSMQTVREGEIARRRASMAEMFDGFWRACINTTDGETDRKNLAMMGDNFPFVADAIISNPPSMAHHHIAERLGIPLHVMFTFPYTPTTQFPHPLANIKQKKNKVDANYVNFMSYPLVETMTWSGLGDLINKFREKTLHLEPVSSLWAPGSMYRMHVPYTYLWSPDLVPKPKDWGPEIDLAGFVFLDLASDFTPPQELADFLDAGDAPVYVGFGSIVVDDPDKFTNMIFEAADKAGVRVLVNKGWGGLGRDNGDTPKNVFMLENTPHDWLFPRVKAVVHHGGAGTTAIGLKLGKPTMIVPFFGDQPFWGARVAEAKAGAHECISYKDLNADRLADGIKQCLTEEAQQNAKKIADSIAAEGDGAENAVEHFQRHLPLSGPNNMCCSLLRDRVAVWRVKESALRLSALAAELLFKQGKLKWVDLRLIRHYEWNDFDGPGGPLTGVAGALWKSVYEMGAGVGEVPSKIAKQRRERQEHEQRVAARIERREKRSQRRAEAAEAEESSQPADANGSGRPPNARQDTTATEASALSTGSGPPISHQILDDFGSGVKRTTGALVTLPNNLGLAIAQGLHNAPRLYGDATVRKPTKITGLKSGVVAAKREFTYGVYDAWTGLVNLPKDEWKEGSSLGGKFVGLGAGVGKGVGGFVLKGVASVVAPPAYVGQGVIKSFEGWWAGPGTKAFVRRARVVQGEEDVREVEKEGETLTALGERAAEGWAVYEAIWALVQGVDSGPAGRVRVRRERKRWEESGALNHVDVAREALAGVRAGEDLEEVMKRRRKGFRRVEGSGETPGVEGGARGEGDKKAEQGEKKEPVGTPMDQFWIRRRLN